jgi:hypothetical protein
VQVAAPEVAARVALALLVRHASEHTGDFLVQGGHDGQR